MERAFTAAQDECLKRAYDMLGEQFEHALIVVDTEASDGSGNASTCYFHGGRIASVGLAEYAKDVLLSKRLTSCE